VGPIVINPSALCYPNLLVGVRRFKYQEFLYFWLVLVPQEDSYPRDPHNLSNLTPTFLSWVFLAGNGSRSRACSGLFPQGTRFVPQPVGLDCFSLLLFGSWAHVDGTVIDRSSGFHVHFPLN